MKLSKFLKRERLIKNKSQTAISEEIGISYCLYNQLENGRSNLSYKTVEKIADYFQITFDEIRRML